MAGHSDRPHADLAPVAEGEVGFARIAARHGNRDAIGRAGPIDNRWFPGALVLAWIWVRVKSRSLLEAAEWGFLATYALSPMLHAWYFVWVLPFAVKSRNLGTIALGASGIAYFLVHHTLAQPGGRWTFAWWERAVIWLSCVVGFVVSSRSNERKRRADN